ncbi:TPA: hypothetical protein MDR30_005194, partial [Klebsiella pneumoniae]|nr:hypothetical protein [Klebsiella pneumoniae]HBV2173101.1 hypothetical protein [Klebsiella pneumoniae]
KKIGPDPRNFNQRVSLGRNDLLIRTFPVVFKSSRREMWDWLDDFVISNGVIPSIADIKKEAESRSGKWTLSNVKIEYQFWKIYHLYKGHFFYQSE